MAIKLTKGQIDAIISKAVQKRREQIKAEEVALAKKASIPANKLTEALKIEWNRLSKEMKDHILYMIGNTYNSETREERFLRTYKERRTKKIATKTKEIDKNQLYNDIVLASIEATDLASLCKKLNIEI